MADIAAIGERSAPRGGEFFRPLRGHPGVRAAGHHDSGKREPGARDRCERPQCGLVVDLDIGGRGQHRGTHRMTGTGRDPVCERDAAEAVGN
jgi:hypothetical protein